MQLRDLTYIRQGRVGLVTFNRPEVLNAVRRETWAELSVVFDEIKAAGLGDAELADVAVQAASWKSIGSGAYASTPVTADGRSATDATSDWALAAVSDITGKALPGLGGTTAQTLPNVTPSLPAFDAGAVSSALSLIGGL